MTDPDNSEMIKRNGKSDPDSPAQKVLQIAEEMGKTSGDIERRLVAVAEHGAVTGEKYEELVYDVRQLQTKYGNLLTHALGQAADLVPEKEERE